MEKKVALVTGAGRGIGRAIALRLAGDGFDVAVNDIDSEAANLVVEEIRFLGKKALSISADVSQREEVFEMVSTVVETLGQLNVMVSNAGIAQGKQLLDIREEDMERMFRINVFGVMYCMQAAAEQMIKQGGGKIINASSVAGRRGSGFLGHYSASKFAVVGLTQSGAIEFAKYGITVNAYCPGVVGTTNMWEALDEELGEYLHLEKGKSMLKSAEKIALGRVQTPEDVAGIVSYLSSKDADYMTGQSLVIDGGMHFS